MFIVEEVYLKTEQSKFFSQSTGNYNAGANNDNTCTDIALICIFNFGIDYFRLTGGTPAEIQFDIDVIISHM